jgi:hypothetical protein
MLCNCSDLGAGRKLNFVASLSAAGVCACECNLVVLDEEEKERRVRESVLEGDRFAMVAAHSI